MYDLIIVGSGPAGLTASIYVSRYRLSNLVIGKLLGGEINLASSVENFPGFLAIPGAELAQKMEEQVKKLGAEMKMETVGRIEKADGGFRVITEEGASYEGRVLIVATGSERRKLGIPGEAEYTGKGVSYCTTCDAPFFREKIVALIGGSDAAVSGAIHTASFAKKVYIIYRGEELRAQPIWVEQALDNPKIEVIYKTNLREIKGDGSKVTGVVLDNPYQGEEDFPLDGVFVEIGGVLGTSLLAPLGVKLDEAGYVIVTPEMETNIKGLFAAGDFTTASLPLQQLITACAQGATAAASAYKLLKQEKAPRIFG